MEYFCTFCECEVIEDIPKWYACYCSTREKDNVMEYPSEWVCVDGRNDGPYDTLEEKYL